MVKLPSRHAQFFCIVVGSEFLRGAWGGEKIGDNSEKISLL
jgi:hypothetical protein